MSSKSTMPMCFMRSAKHRAHGRHEHSDRGAGGRGDPISAFGVAHLFKLTSGRLGIAQFAVPPGIVGATPHVHHEHDEWFFVLEGVLTVATEEGEVALLPGDLAYAPRGSVHGFRNAAGPADAGAVCLHAPWLRATSGTCMTRWRPGSR